MQITRLELENFRSYKSKTYHFSDLSVIVGANATGKTNVLEAIYLLSTGDSFRARKIEEMVRWDQELSRVTGIVEQDGDVISLGVTLTRGVLMGRRTQKRRYLVDGNPRTKKRFLQHLYVVLFRPEDLRLVEGSPSRRRRFIDETLSMIDHGYARSLKSYEDGLRRRNKLLDSIREGEAKREQLAFWDATIIKHGNILTDKRREFLDYLSRLEVAFGKYMIEYDYSAISPKRLAKYEREEVAAGYTLVGPHKDDFIIYSREKAAGDKGKDLHVYGSRGEQRLAVLFLKLGVLEYMEKEIGVTPTLLLDDIFSELDVKHRKEVLRMTEDRQTIITTADEYILDDLREKKIEVMRI